VNRTIHSFFSGGRDSALSSFIAYKVAKTKGWKFKLIFINTTIAVPDTLNYVHEYANWLNVELVELRPAHTFEELVIKYSYPALWFNRWCYYTLKRGPTIEYLNRNYKPNDIVTMGIRGSESLFRLINYDKVFSERCYGDLCVKAWYPILRLTDIEVENLIRKFRIPRNPVWDRIGMSGDCLCLAGTSESKLERIAIYYPNIMEKYVELDKKVQANRKNKQPSYPAPLYHKKMTLSEWYEKFKKQQRIDVFLTEYGSCQLGCMLE
jgi:3'-phosphoadenosine 5'-phosphosulfate sulfotransferase (PAPS reductase)/FAD synthetase